MSDVGFSFVRQSRSHLFFTHFISSPCTCFSTFMHRIGALEAYSEFSIRSTACYVTVVYSFFYLLIFVFGCDALLAIVLCSEWRLMDANNILHYERHLYITWYTWVTYLSFSFPLRRCDTLSPIVSCSEWGQLNTNKLAIRTSTVRYVIHITIYVSSGPPLSAG